MGLTVRDMVKVLDRSRLSFREDMIWKSLDEMKLFQDISATSILFSSMKSVNNMKRKQGMYSRNGNDYKGLIVVFVERVPDSKSPIGFPAH
jgi:hypothetical protein